VRNDRGAAVTISLVDYGLGNLGSVVNMLKRIGVPTSRVRTPDEVAESERILLPGIGAFDSGMGLLADHALVGPLRDFAASGRPILGICLGMQLLLDGSDEGEAPGLGLIPGRSVRFDDAVGVRVPHMGWNRVEPARADSMFDGLPDDSRFYFVHSYRVVPESEDAVLGSTHYGVDFVSMIRAGNVVGAQFHPEKSHAFGMTMLRNFASI
jgi:glutamine amidotransferase